MLSHIHIYVRCIGGDAMKYSKTLTLDQNIWSKADQIADAHGSNITAIVALSVSRMYDAWMEDKKK